MSSTDDTLTWLILGLIVLAVGGFYLWRLVHDTRGLLAALTRLRDRIDRAKRW